MIVPFFIPHAACPHQCVFCDQRRISGERAGPDPGGIAETILRYRAAEGTGDSVEVAFYGGTFTALPPERQRAYLGPVQPLIASGIVRSIRISTRPDAIDGASLDILRRHHVETVEIGAQSLDDEVLRRSGRGHSADHVVRSVERLKQGGFAVGIQLMAGLPGDRPAAFRMTVEGTIGLRPDLVRLYPALVIAGTRLEELYRSGRYAPLSREEAIAWCAEALDSFERKGIPVVRVGLQPTAELERGGTVVAGPYHPAFRQLVDSSRFLEKMLRAMHPGAEPDFLVHPADLGSAVGHRRENLAALSARFGKAATVLPDDRVRKGCVEMARRLPDGGKSTLRRS